MQYQSKTPTPPDLERGNIRAAGQGVESGVTFIVTRVSDPFIHY